MAYNIKYYLTTRDVTPYDYIIPLRRAQETAWCAFNITDVFKTKFLFILSTQITLQLLITCYH